MTSRLLSPAATSVQIVGDLPNFATDATAEILARQGRLSELLVDALENLPRTSEQLALEFETRYLGELSLENLTSSSSLGFPHRRPASAINSASHTSSLSARVGDVAFLKGDDWDEPTADELR